MSRLRWLDAESLRTEPGKHRCGDNLWLTVSEPGRGSRIFRANVAAKPIEMGLDSTRDESYAEGARRQTWPRNS